MRSNTYAFGAQQFLPPQGWFPWANNVVITHLIPTFTPLPIPAITFSAGYSRIIGTVQVDADPPSPFPEWRSCFVIYPGRASGIPSDKSCRRMYLGGSDGFTNTVPTMPTPGDPVQGSSTNIWGFEYPQIGAGFEASIETFFCDAFPLVYTFNIYLVPV